jgi:hypothetical protein
MSDSLAMIAACAQRQSPAIPEEIVLTSVEAIPPGFNAEGRVPEEPSIAAGYQPLAWVVEVTGP